MPAHDARMVRTMTTPLDALRLRVDLERYIATWGALPEVRAIAGTALRATNAPHDPLDDAGRARCIAEWVRARVRYAPEVGEIVESPGYALGHGVADCDGMTWTVGALCVAVGLQVRVRLAYLARDGALLPVHVWPEAYCRRARVWMPLDLALPVPIGTPAAAAIERAVARGVGLGPRGV
jgi:transglutaminase-like putative cysteine protease